MITQTDSNGNVPKESLTKRLGISEGVALGAATMGGYLYAFSYETGYLSHYAVPSWLIQLSLVNVLLAFGAIVFVLVLVPYVLAALPVGPWWALLVQMSQLVLPVGFTVFVAAVTDWQDWRSVIVGLVLGLFPALYSISEIRRRLVAPIFLYKEAGNWPERWATAFRIQRRRLTSQPDLLTHSIRAIGAVGIRESWLFLFWLLFMAGPISARYLGLGAAYFKTRHVLISDADECIAVRRYADYIICTRFNRQTRQLLPSFRLLRTGTPETNQLRIEEIGRMSAPSPVGRKR